MSSRSGTIALPTDMRAWIEDATGTTVVAADRQAGGGRKEAWLVDVERPDGTADSMFLRWDQVDPATTGDPWTVRREAEVYRALRDTDVPVAGFIALHPTAQAMLATRVYGRNWFSHITDPDHRLTIARDFIGHLAALHRLDVHRLGIPGFDPDAPVREMVLAQLDEMEALITFAGGEPEAALRLGLDWLRANIPSYDGPAVLVQGDTGPGNFMYDDDHVTAIVDWELAHLGDPMDDLAWISLRSVQEPFPDLATRFREYAEASGHAVDVARIRYYRVLAETKIMTMGHARRVEPVTEGAGSDPGARLIFGQLHRRLLVEALADVMGVELELPVIATEPAPTERDALYDVVLRQLRDVVTPRIDDGFALQRTKGLARVLKYLAAANRRGAEFEREELADLTAVLAEAPADVDAGRSALAAAVRAGAIDQVAALRVLYRQIARENELLRASSGALADRHYEPLEA